MIGVGAGLGIHHRGRYLYPNAKSVQIDLNPADCTRAAHWDMHIKADARHRLKQYCRSSKRRAIHRGAPHPCSPIRLRAWQGGGWQRVSRCTRHRGSCGPRCWSSIRLSRRTGPCVSGGAHFAGILVTHMYGRRAENVHVINEFGAIGSAFPIAIGMAATRGDGKLLLIEGDGSLMMHIQELETIRRHGIRMLICTVNDGGYGAEVHKFRAQGYDPAESQHGRGDIAAIARGFGLRGEKITSLERFKALFAAHEKAGQAELWDLHVDDKIPSAPYRRIHFGEV